MLKDLVRNTAIFERLAGLKHRKTSFSQFGEDVHISSIYERLAFTKKVVTIENGWTVTVGSYRPIVHSNTYIFNRKGWRGINIDPTPGSALRFDRVCRRDINLEVAIGESTGEGSFYVFGTPSVYNTLDPAMAEAASRVLGKKPIIMPVQIRRLDNILDQHMASPVSFEILSIDAEGHDIVILRSNDFGRYRPRIIVIEVHGLTAQSIATHETVTFLEGSGYHLFSWLNPNLIFLRSDSLLD